MKHLYPSIFRRKRLKRRGRKNEKLRTCTNFACKNSVQYICLFILVHAVQFCTRRWKAERCRFRVDWIIGRTFHFTLYFDGFSFLYSKNKPEFPPCLEGVWKMAAIDIYLISSFLIFFFFYPFILWLYAFNFK